MRDPVLEEALRRLAGEAATRFSSLIAGGEEVPFDVAEAEGDSSLFYRYVPLTREFVERHADELRSLPSFGSACGAVNMKGAAAPYLEARGETVPADPDERAGKMLLRFIGELWDGCSEFTLDRNRLDEGLAALEAEVRDVHHAEMLVTPLVGLQMTPPAIELPEGVRIVRADTVDAPTEAMTSEGTDREPWDPQFLALVEIASGSDSVSGAIEQLGDVITAMRLFKTGGIGLGPFAYAPVAEGRWRRVGTCAAPVRAESYELDDEETGRLIEMAGWIVPRLRAARASRAPGALGWSLRRFEMGRERRDPLEAMTDHMLALRSIIDGEGPVGAPLPVRAAALIAGGHDDREQARQGIEAVLRVEKEMTGGRQVDGDSERQLARWFEDSVRELLRVSAAGELGDDVGLAADESLLSAGLDEGEGSLSQRGDTAEWEMSAGAPDELLDPRDDTGLDPRDDTGLDSRDDTFVDPPEEFDPGDPDRMAGAPFHEAPEGTGLSEEESVESVDDSVRSDYHDDPEEITRIMEPVPGDESEIRITATADAPQEEVERDPASGDEEEMRIRSDWLSEVSAGNDRPAVEWPVGQTEPVRSTRREREPGELRREREPGEFPRQRIDTPRVRHLFPVPDNADWQVRELDYDRRAR